MPSHPRLQHQWLRLSNPGRLGGLAGTSRCTCAGKVTGSHLVVLGRGAESPKAMGVWGPHPTLCVLHTLRWHGRRTKAGGLLRMQVLLLLLLRLQRRLLQRRPHALLGASRLLRLLRRPSWRSACAWRRPHAQPWAEAGRRGPKALRWRLAGRP